MVKRLELSAFLALFFVMYGANAINNPTYLSKPALFSSCANIYVGSLVIDVPKQTPFSYDLHIKHIASKTENNEVTICCHGYGHNYSIVDAVHSYKVLPGHLIGFNFPDHDITSRSDHHKSVYGTIDEILPLLYLIKYYACDLKVPVINLYGFSAGGGAVVNALAIMNQYAYKERLWHVAGISRGLIAHMLAALERGFIVLDCPLKSFNEIIALRGRSSALEIMASRYAQNNMNPIDAVRLLWKMNLNIFLHFQKPDEILGNRDDALFISRLKYANKGTTSIIISSDGGHNVYHAGLWDQFKKLKQS